jgi:hypothetical protein
MPSSSFVEVDICNNNTAIIDSSSETVVIASAPPSEQHEESGKHNAISPIPPKSALNTAGDCVSPKKLAMEAKTASKGKKAKASSANASTSVVTPRTKEAKATTLTPPNVAVATPGDSEKKTKKKAGLTLDSFFSKGKKLVKPVEKAVGKNVEKKVEQKSIEKSVEKPSGKSKEDTVVQEKTTEEVAGKGKISIDAKEGENKKDVKTSATNEPKAEAKSAKRSKPPSKPMTKRSTKASPKMSVTTPSFFENDENSASHAVAVAVAQMGRRRGKRAVASVLEKTGVDDSVAETTDVKTCDVESAGTEKAGAALQEQVEMDSAKTVDVQQTTATIPDVSDVVQPTESKVENIVDSTDDDDKTVELDEDKIIPTDDSNSNSSQPSVFPEEPAPIDEVVCDEVQVESPITSPEKDNSPNDAIVVDPPKQSKESDTPAAKISDVKSKKKAAGKSTSKATKPKGMSIADSFKMFTAAPSKSSKSTFIKKSVTAVTTEGDDKIEVNTSKPSADNKSEPSEMTGVEQTPNTSTALAAEELQVPEPTPIAKTCTESKTSSSEAAALPISEPTPVVKTSTESKSLSSKAATPKAKSVRTPKPSKTAPAETEAKKTTPSVPPSDENSAKMKEYSTLRERYVIRAVEVASRSASDDFIEESLSDADLPSLEKESVEIGADGGFPDELLPRLLVLVQGR